MHSHLEMDPAPVCLISREHSPKNAMCDERGTIACLRDARDYSSRIEKAHTAVSAIKLVIDNGTK